jgi:hypothetical protein
MKGGGEERSYNTTTRVDTRKKESKQERKEPR